jgi:hypothetical protein
LYHYALLTGVTRLQRKIEAKNVSHRYRERPSTLAVMVFLSSPRITAKNPLRN